MIVEILALVANYGGVGLIIIGAALLFYKLVIHRFTSGGNTNKSDKLSSIKVDNQRELRVHSLFKNARYRISVEIPFLNITPEKPVKQQLIRDLLLIETQVIHDVCFDFIKNDIEDLGPDEWIAEIIKLLDDIMMKFLDKTKAEGIPNPVIVKFNKWQHQSFNALYTYADTFGKSRIYLTNLSRTNTFYHIINLMLITTLADAERTLQQLNGDISGKMYKGQIIEP